MSTKKKHWVLDSRNVAKTGKRVKDAVDSALAKDLADFFEDLVVGSWDVSHDELSQAFVGDDGTVLMRCLLSSVPDYCDGIVSSEEPDELHCSFTLENSARNIEVATLKVDVKVENGTFTVSAPLLKYEQSIPLEDAFRDISRCFKSVTWLLDSYYSLTVSWVVF